MPTHTDCIFHCCQYSSRTNHPNAEKCYNEVSKLCSMAAEDAAVQKYFALILFLKQELRYKKTFGLLILVKVL